MMPFIQKTVFLAFVRPAQVLPIGLICGLLMLVGCQVHDDRAEVKALLDDFYQALGEQQFERAVSFFDHELLDDGGRDIQLTLLKTMHDSIGPLQDHAIVNLDVNTIYRGRLYIVDLITGYQHGKKREVIIVFDGVDSDGLKIVSRVLSDNI